MRQHLVYRSHSPPCSADAVLIAQIGERCGSIKQVLNTLQQTDNACIEYLGALTAALGALVTHPVVGCWFSLGVRCMNSTEHTHMHMHMHTYTRTHTHTTQTHTHTPRVHAQWKGFY